MLLICRSGRTALKSVRNRATFARKEGVRVASILPFIPRGVFDDAATKAMGEAFDAACQALHDRGQPTVVYEVMARRIIGRGA